MKKILLIATVITLVMSSMVCADSVDLQKFLLETQKLQQGKGTMLLIWWIPTEYWEETFKNEPNMTRSQKDAFCNAVDGYSVFAVLDAKISELGSIMPIPKEKIVNEIYLSIGDKQLLPLKDEELTSDAKNIFAAMKPLMGNMLGQVGQGVEFVCFKGTDLIGERLLDPKTNKTFAINYLGHSYKWRLPLGRLLPVKLDKKTGEEFPGNFIYNPFTGDMLINKQ